MESVTAEVAAEASHSLVVYALVLLAAAVFVVTLFRKLRMSPVLGYLGAGMAIGPYGLGLVTDAESLNHFAEIGVVFLLFSIGLDLSLERIKLLRRYMLGLGSVQVAVTSAVFTGIGVLMGLTLETAMVVGAALALSSTPVALQLFMEKGEQSTRHGQVGIAVLILQDLAVVPLLTLIPVIKTGGDHMGMLVAQAMGIAFVAMMAIFLLGRLIMRPLYSWVATGRDHDVFIAMTLLVALGAGWLTAHFGISMALGALLAGILISETEFRTQVQSDIRPFGGLLLGLFFMSVGMLMELPLLKTHFWPIFALTAGMLIIKIALLAVAIRMFRLTWGVAIRVGVLLSQAGEYAFIVFGVAGQAGLMDDHLRQILLLVVTLSMVTTPFLDFFAARIAARIDREQAVLNIGQVREETQHLKNHVLVVGFGRVGQTVAHLLELKGLSYVALEQDVLLVKRAQSFHNHIYFGDAMREPVLEAVGTERAAVAVVTLRDPVAASQCIAMLRKNFPRLHICARLMDIHNEEVLREAGADTIVPDEVEASLILAKLVATAAGADTEGHVLDEIRAKGYRFMDTLVNGEQETHRPRSNAPAPSKSRVRRKNTQKA